MKIYKSGFTLMEVVVAAVILAAVLVGLLGIFTGSLKLIESCKNLTIAINHARCVTEEIRNVNNLSNITGNDWAAWAQSEPPSGGACNSLNNEQVQVSYTDIDGDGDAQNDDPLCITVTVSWNNRGGRTGSTQLVTLLTER